jgi:Fic family protein
MFSSNICSVKAEDFASGAPGDLVINGEGALAFVPHPLPPVALQPSFELMSLISDADVALARLDGIARSLDDPEILVRPFVRREALDSSRIEGTQTTYSQLVLFEAASEARKNEAAEDTRFVAAYVTALNYGLARCRDLPISRRLISEVHAELMRGSNARPGRFRDGDVAIGRRNVSTREARFVPPPARYIDDLFSDLEKFLHTDNALPLLVRAGLVHYQFETIHPFWDGNGRLGRLLISLMLCAEQRLLRPVLYLSGYFENNRDEYYDSLLSVSKVGSWNQWLSFFCRAVRTQSEDGFRRIHDLRDLRDHYKSLILQRKRSSASLMRLLDIVMDRTIASVPMIRKQVDISPPSAKDLITRFIELGILVPFPTPGLGSTQYYMAPKVLDILNRP